MHFGRHSYSQLMCCAVRRLIPCVVVMYRMLMVCHVEFCCNHGEKVIRDRLCG